MGHVYLIGFMGCGKSTVGPVLAKKLDLPFTDLDAYIEAKEGSTIQRIFDLEGESYFRNLEKNALSKLSTEPPQVIALGGGAFIDEENSNLMRRTGKTVWLRISLALAKSRCLSDSERPLARNRDRFAALYRSRQSHYAKATIHVDIEGKTPVEICDEIVSHLK